MSPDAILMEHYKHKNNQAVMLCPSGIWNEILLSGYVSMFFVLVDFFLLLEGCSLSEQFGFVISKLY